MTLRHESVITCSPLSKDAQVLLLSGRWRSGGAATWVLMQPFTSLPIKGINGFLFQARSRRQKPLFVGRRFNTKGEQIQLVSVSSMLKGGDKDLVFPC